MPDLKSLARQALANCNAFADAATKTVNGQSQSYQKIAAAYHNLAGLIIAEMNVEAEDRQIRQRTTSPQRANSDDSKRREV